MKIKQLSKILRTSLDTSPKKEKVTRIFLFCIKYKEEIERLGIRELIQEAGIPNGYTPEMNKGLRLANYVVIKEQI